MTTIAPYSAFRVLDAQNVRPQNDSGALPPLCEVSHCPGKSTGGSPGTGSSIQVTVRVTRSLLFDAYRLA